MPNGTLLLGWRKRWNRSLLQFIGRRVRTSVDVEDLAQETYLRLLRARPFDVMAAETIVRAVGTQFNVDRRPAGQQQHHRGAAERGVSQNLQRRGAGPDASLLVGTDDGPWHVTLGVNNATDKLYAIAGNSSLSTGSGYAEIAYARPREYFGMIAYSF